VRERERENYLSYTKQKHKEYCFSISGLTGSDVSVLRFGIQIEFLKQTIKEHKPSMHSFNVAIADCSYMFCLPHITIIRLYT
jgi:hypothetical protein